MNEYLEKTFDDCYARWNADEVVLGNSLIERRWQWREGWFHATSLFDKVTGREWLAQASALNAPTPTGRPLPMAARPTAEARCTRDWTVEAEALELTLQGQDDSGAVAARFRIYPGLAAVSAMLVDERKDKVHAVQSPDTPVRRPTGVELSDAALAAKAFPASDLMEYLEVAPAHVRLRQISFRDQTDICNELVFAREWLLSPSDVHQALEGNLFILEDVFSKSGLIFLKHAPLPRVRPEPGVHGDFRFDGSRVGPWVKPDAMAAAEPRGYLLGLYGHANEAVSEGYRWAVLAFHGGEPGVTRALQAYQRRLRPYTAGRDGRFLTNTWGDRSQDSRINEAFMLSETQAAGSLGAEVVQLDDGWQQGTTSNSVQAGLLGGVWEGFHNKDSGFWNLHSGRFPNGLEPLVETARRQGQEIGLWFAPDSHDHFANWRKDAEALLAFHRRWGIRYFKLDSIKLRSRTGEKRLEALFRLVQQESDGQVVMELDVTAEERPGYFGAMALGPVFVENRYTDSRRYWPHLTLRNLWSLARYVHPSLLRMEFLNPARNQDVYGDDPLAPARYTPEYLFATVMFSNPLGWFEVSHLPEEFVQRVATLAEVWKTHRDAVFSGEIFPIGEQPDGTSWTGFLARAEAGDAERWYVLAFRECTDRGECEMPAPFAPEREGSFKRLAGVGEARLSGGSLRVQIAGPRQFFFGQLDFREAQRM